MKKTIEKTIELSPEMTAIFENDILTLKNNSKEITKKFRLNRVNLETKDNKITVYSKSATKRESKIIGTTIAHINNMIKGFEKDFEYKLEICNVHFPMNVKVEGENVIIKSFLGEKSIRKAKILPNSKVDVKGSQITITSHNIEDAGQTAANIEKASRLVGRDRRIFQDGIFITEKNGRKI